MFFQTTQTKFLLSNGAYMTIAFQQNVHYYRFCSHCFQALLIIGIFLFAKATLSVSEKIHLPWSANEWSLIWERTLISYDSSSNLTHLGVESMGDTLLNWCQLSPVCIGEGNSIARFSPVSTNMQHNLGKLQFIVLENYICSCVVGF